jgi:hypothetical protein
MQNVKIPQNVRVEDKIIGPFSLKQLLLVGFGGGFSYALYAMLNKSFGYVPLSAHALIWWPGILATAFALVRINDIPLSRYCLLVLESLSKPRIRHFQARQGLTINIQTRLTKKEAKNALVTKGATGDVSLQDIRIEDLSTLLDAEGKKEAPSMTIGVDPLEKSVDTFHVPTHG